MLHKEGFFYDNRHVAGDNPDSCLALTRTQEIFLGSGFFCFFYTEIVCVYVKSMSCERTGKIINFLNIFMIHVEVKSSSEHSQDHIISKAIPFMWLDCKITAVNLNTAINKIKKS